MGGLHVLTGMESPEYCQGTTTPKTICKRRGDFLSGKATIHGAVREWVLRACAREGPKQLLDRIRRHPFTIIHNRDLHPRLRHLQQRGVYAHIFVHHFRAAAEGSAHAAGAAAGTGNRCGRAAHGPGGLTDAHGNDCALRRELHCVVALRPGRSSGGDREFETRGAQKAAR